MAEAGVEIAITSTAQLGGLKETLHGLRETREQAQRAQQGLAVASGAYASMGSVLRALREPGQNAAAMLTGLAGAVNLATTALSANPIGIAVAATAALAAAGTFAFEEFYARPAAAAQELLEKAGQVRAEVRKTNEEVRKGIVTEGQRAGERVRLEEERRIAAQQEAFARDALEKDAAMRRRWSRGTTGPVRRDAVAADLMNDDQRGRAQEQLATARLAREEAEKALAALEAVDLARNRAQAVLEGRNLQEIPTAEETLARRPPEVPESDPLSGAVAEAKARLAAINQEYTLLNDAIEEQQRRLAAAKEVEDAAAERAARTELDELEARRSALGPRQQMAITAIQDAEKAVAARNAELEVTRATIAADRAINEAAYAQGLVDLEGYLAQRRALIERDFAAQKGAPGANQAAIEQAQRGALAGDAARAGQERLAMRLKEARAAVEKRLLDVERERVAVESATSLSRAEREARLLPILEAERTAITEAIAALKEIEGTQEVGSAGAELVGGQRRGLEGRLGEIDGEVASTEGLSMGGFGEVAGALNVDVLSEAKTIFEEIYEVTQGITDAFANGLASSITGLLMQTMTWGQALRNIGLSIVNELIASFARMAAEWVAKHVIMKGAMIAFDALGTALGMKKVAESNAQEKAKMPAIQANAAGSAAGSWGMSVIVGLAVLLGMMAMFGGFAAGGFTGSGGRDEPAGIVHRGEWVVPKWRTNELGLGFLEELTYGQGLSGVPMGLAEGGLAGGSRRLHSGSLGMVAAGLEGDAGGNAGKSGGGGGQTIFIVSNEEEAMRMAAERGITDALVIDAIRRNQHVLG